MNNKVFRRDDDLAVILHSNTKQTTLKNVTERDLIQQLKRQGYSKQAIQEILEWYRET